MLKKTTPLSSTLHIDVDGLLTCSIWANFEEVMHVQTFAVLGATPRPLLYSSNVPGQRPTSDWGDFWA